MSLSVGLPLLIIGTLLQGGLLPLLAVRGGRPDIILLIIVSWSVLGRDWEGMVWAFVGGMLLDLFSGAPLGVSSVGLLLAAFVAGTGTGVIGRFNVFFPVVMIAAGTLVYHASSFVLLVLLGLQPATWMPSLLYVTLPSGLLNLGLIIPAFLLLGFVHSWLHPRRAMLLRSVRGGSV